jgi:NADH/NAD ratio-sensing transcriptional regulator Rex
MEIATQQVTRIDTHLLKRLSKMYESRIAIKDISEELKIDFMTIKRLLKLLGYNL